MVSVGKSVSLGSLNESPKSQGTFVIRCSNATSITHKKFRRLGDMTRKKVKKQFTFETTLRVTNQTARKTHDF